METKNKIQKIGFWSFNTLKEYIPKSIEKEKDILPIGYTTKKFTNEHYRKKEQYDANKYKIIGFSQMET